MFLDGVLQQTITTNLTIKDTNQRFQIGYFLNRANSYYHGYLQDFRITKGVARYSSNFTPPTQQFYPGVTDTKIDLYVDGYLDGTFTYPYDNNEPQNLNSGNPRPRIAGFNTSEGRVDGKYALVKVYDRAMSNGDIQQNYNATYRRFRLPALTPTPTPTMT